MILLLEGIFGGLGLFFAWIAGGLLIVKIISTVLGIAIGFITLIFALYEEEAKGVINNRYHGFVQATKQRLENSKISKFSSFKTWLPKHKREEIPGDLKEIKAAMIEAGFSKRKIKWQLTQLKISILWNLYKRQLLDWLSQQIKISR